MYTFITLPQDYSAATEHRSLVPSVYFTYICGSAHARHRGISA